MMKLQHNGKPFKVWFSYTKEEVITSRGANGFTYTTDVCTCHITAINDDKTKGENMATGVAVRSYLDSNNRKIARKIALSKALSSVDTDGNPVFDKEFRKGVWANYFYITDCFIEVDEDSFGSIYNAMYPNNPFLAHQMVDGVVKPPNISVLPFPVVAVKGWAQSGTIEENQNV